MLDPSILVLLLLGIAQIVCHDDYHFPKNPTSIPQWAWHDYLVNLSNTPACKENSKTADWILQHNETTIRIPLEYLHSDNTFCIAKKLATSTGNNFYYVSDFRRINQEFSQFSDWEVVEVQCKFDNQNYRRVISLIPEKKILDNKNVSTPNVLFISLEGILLNITKQYLKEKNFYEFYNHHNVGHDTVANLFGMMLGEKEKDWKAKLAVQDGDTGAIFDSLPFIFKEYSNRRYLTTFLDNSGSVFNFPGFPITDYNLKAANLAIRHDDEQFNGVCYEDEMEISYYLQYILTQIHTLKLNRSQSFFTWAHFSTIGFTSEQNQLLDFELFNRLSTIIPLSWESTMIVLYSDHQITGTPIGTQNALPQLFVHIPGGFKLMDSNGHLMSGADMRYNLEQNSQRNTSQMDIHATLRHVLYERPPNMSIEKYGKSLLDYIPSDRTCNQMGIPPELCLWEYSNIFASYLVKFINQERNSEKCAFFRKDRVIKMKFLDINSNRMVINLILIAVPSGEFEVTLSAIIQEDGKLVPGSIEIIGQISRNDPYWQHSHCMAGEPGESFCHCKEPGKLELEPDYDYWDEDASTSGSSNVKPTILLILVTILVLITIGFLGLLLERFWHMFKLIT